MHIPQLTQSSPCAGQQVAGRAIAARPDHLELPSSNPICATSGGFGYYDGYARSDRRRRNDLCRCADCERDCHVDVSYGWYIDKHVKRYGRLCESTGTDY